jgi:LPS export ABC transporter protein LptC
LLPISCADIHHEAAAPPDPTVITQLSDTLTIISSENGRKSYRLQTPLVEGYGNAKEPYTEFRKGIFIETFKDSTQQVESTLVADYAIHFDKQELWEAKGNVKAVNEKGQILETQQLFWNQRTHKIYSNIDSKVTQGSDVIVGVGFESDEEFKVWEFRKPRGKLTVDIEPNRDTTTNKSSATGQPKTLQPQPQSTPRSEDNSAARPSGAQNRNRTWQQQRPQSPTGQQQRRSSNNPPAYQPVERREPPAGMRPTTPASTTQAATTVSPVRIQRAEVQQQQAKEPKKK